MKKSLFMLTLQLALLIGVQAQNVSNYTCKLDNGILIKTEKCWGHIWVSQISEPLKAAETTPLTLNLRTLGDLTSGSSFKLLSSGKEVSVKSAKPGTYSMKMSYKLSGKPGTLSFEVGNIVIKPQNKTVVTVTLYDYQVLIEEVPGSQKGLSAYSSKVDVYKGYAEQNPSCGVPAFYLKGAHDKPILPAETTNNKKGKIKPGTYDVLITIGNPGRLQKVWLENFTLKPDITYNITTNLNAGIVTYSGGNKDVKALHLYPAGTADRQKGAATPDKNLEILRCEGQAMSSPCAPGSYDVLMNFGNGTRYEWRKNLVISTGRRTEVK